MVCGCRGTSYIWKTLNYQEKYKGFIKKMWSSTRRLQGYKQSPFTWNNLYITSKWWLQPSLTGLAGLYNKRVCTPWTSCRGWWITHSDSAAAKPTGSFRLWDPTKRKRITACGRIYNLMNNINTSGIFIY